MRSPEGQEIWSTGVYREVTPPERVVMTASLADAGGNVVPAAHYGFSADWPLETLITVTFAEDDGKTTMTLRHTVGAAAAAEREGAQQGWSESFDRLAEYLAAA